LLGLVAAVAACGGRGLGGKAPDASGGAGTDGGVDTAGAAGTTPSGVDAGADVVATIGWGPVRRLTDTEYDNTMRDLLGVEAGARRAFGRGNAAADTPTGLFDGVATDQRMPPERLAWYFASAVSLTDQVWADPTLRARIVTCAPVSPNDDGCARAIVAAFGRLAWRRLLEPGELDGLVALARDAQTRGDDFATAMKQVAVALLVSESFLYRIEIDPDPNAPVAHPLTAYELATRLSYLLWSTTPTSQMLDAAQTGTFDTRAGLAKAVTEMLIDQRSSEFVRDFAGQWLGFRALNDEPIVWWTPAVQQAAAEEARLFAAWVVREDRYISELLIGDVNFVNDALAPTYGFPAPNSAEPQLVSVKSDQRRGYMGLVAPLVQTSFATESSPSRRGAWVLERMLCLGPPPPHPNTPEPTNTGAARVAEIGAQVACAACHHTFDPLGLGFERFDQLGRHRESYSGGQPADDRGTLADGRAFRGPGELGSLLERDPAFWRCVARQALTYALGRRMDGDVADEATVDRFVAPLVDGHGTFLKLLANLVTDDAFRLRRGEGQP
jgi:hypothetical protein